ncbi:hypothetical protein GCM10022226_39260 [Sphaerisporangium flaviroseum]|uniref:Uncharacterized protein n=1 Tax=Sphaerisporangium flaviroseum TaxID=509199 RepID=A0ABP7IBV2_9ACTN
MAWGLATTNSASSLRAIQPADGSGSVTGEAVADDPASGMSSTAVSAVAAERHGDARSMPYEYRPAIIRQSHFAMR